MENMDDIDENEQETNVIEPPDVESRSGSINEPEKTNQPPPTSLIQALLTERNEEKDEKSGKKKKKKKVKTAREKELERLTKATKNIFNSPHELNLACERINSLLSNRESSLLSACRSLDRTRSGRLLSEQFRLILRDRLPQISKDDTFILIKLFENDGMIDYRAVLSQKPGINILRYVTSLPVPSTKDIILETKPKKSTDMSLLPDSTKHVTIHVRFIPFDSLNIYPGHISFTIPDHLSIYALSKMIIDERDFSTRSISLFREKVPSKTTLLNPMQSLANCNYTGAYIDGTHHQLFPTYTLYYDYSSVDVGNNCPILKCDYYMK